MTFEPSPDIRTAIGERERRQIYASRHALFCEGRSMPEPGDSLEICPIGDAPFDLPHDVYDPISALVGAWLPSENKSDLVIASSRLVFGKLPTSAVSDRLSLDLMSTPGTRYSEPSRLGVDRDYQGSRLGRVALLRIVGVLCELSIEHQHDHFLMTLRPKLMESLWWFPWALWPPFEYPPHEGGSLIDEPMWPATLNLHSLALYAKLKRRDSYETMFPNGTEQWLNSSKTPPFDELDVTVKLNHQSARNAMQAWEDGNLHLSQLD